MSDNLGIQFDENPFTAELKAWANKLATESHSNVWISSAPRTTPDYDASALWCGIHPNRMILPDIAHDGQFWYIPSTWPRSIAEVYEVSPEELRPLNVPKIKEILDQRDAVTESWESKELDEFLDEFKKNGGDSA